MYRAIVQGPEASETPWLSRPREVFYVGQRSGCPRLPRVEDFGAAAGASVLYKGIVPRSRRGDHCGRSRESLPLPRVAPGCAVPRGAAREGGDLGRKANATNSPVREHAAHAFERPNTDRAVGRPARWWLHTTYFDDRVRPPAENSIEIDRGGEHSFVMLTSQGLICDRKLRLGHTRSRDATTRTPPAPRLPIFQHAGPHLARRVLGPPFPPARVRPTRARTLEARRRRGALSAKSAGAFCAVAHSSGHRRRVRDRRSPCARESANAAGKLVTSTGKSCHTRDPRR